MKKKLSKLCLMIVCCCLSVFSFAANSTKSTSSPPQYYGQIAIFDLKHRTGPELLPLLKPFVDRKGTIRASGNKLIVRSHRDNIDEVTQLIARLDKPLRMLTISLRQTDTPPSNRYSRQANHAQDTIFSKQRIITTSTSHRRQKSLFQRVKTLEGKVAWINASTSFPVVNSISQNQYGTNVNIQQRRLISGFKVRATILDSGVRLWIKTRRKRTSESHGGRTNGSNSANQLTVPLGEWVTIAQSAPETSNTTQPVQSLNSRPTVITRTSSKNPQTYIQIRVDLAQ